MKRVVDLAVATLVAVVVVVVVAVVASAGRAPLRAAVASVKGLHGSSETEPPAAGGWLFPRQGSSPQFVISHSTVLVAVASTVQLEVQCG